MAGLFFVVGDRFEITYNRVGNGKHDINFKIKLLLKLALGRTLTEGGLHHVL